MVALLAGVWIVATLPADCCPQPPASGNMNDHCPACPPRPAPESQHSEHDHGDSGCGDLACAFQSEGPEAPLPARLHLEPERPGTAALPFSNAITLNAPPTASDGGGLLTAALPRLPRHILNRSLLC